MKRATGEIIVARGFCLPIRDTDMFVNTIKYEMLHHITCFKSVKCDC